MTKEYLPDFDSVKDAKEAGAILIEREYIGGQPTGYYWVIWLD